MKKHPEFGIRVPIVEKLPEYTDKCIYWSKESDSHYGFILIGYCPDTLPYFMAMLNAALRDFPDLDQNEVTFGKVTRSRYNEGFTLMRFNVPGKRRNIKGWVNFEGNIDFCY